MGEQANMTEDQVYQDNSTDLLGLDGEADESHTTEVTSQSWKRFVRHSDQLIHRQPDHPTRWSRQGNNNTHSIKEGKNKTRHPPLGKPATKRWVKLRALMTQQGKPYRCCVITENGKVRRKEGNGLVRMARKQRQLDDWISWRDAWRSSQASSRSRPKWTETEDDKSQLNRKVTGNYQ